MLLLALFIGVPLVEIALFIQLGSVLDLGWILLIVVLTAILGTWLVRRQGREVLQRIQGSLETLNDPTEPLAHGAMILFSGALLLTPGFFTDSIGFLLLIPAFREVAFRFLRKRVIAHGTVSMNAGPRPGAPGQGPMTGGRGATSRDDIIDGEYEDLDTSARGRERTSQRKPSGWTQD